MELELDDLLNRLCKLEEEFEKKVGDQRTAFGYRLQKGRAVFDQKILSEHRRFKKGLFQFLAESTYGNLIIAPIVYFLILPFVALDLSIWLYQRICFTVWGIKRVPRNHFIVIDRQHLAYLNPIEKLNCVFCGYATGLIAYVREVAGRTEQYWCPIKHSVRTQSAHARYRHFIDYGDAEGFRDRLEQFREEVRKSSNKTSGTAL